MVEKNLRRLWFSFSFMFFIITISVSHSFGAPSAADILKRKGFVWKSVVTEHLRLHFEPGTLAETRIEELKRFQEKAFAKNLQLLKIDDYSSFASKVLNFEFLPQKSGYFENSRIENKELNILLPQKCLKFPTFEAKPIIRFKPIFSLLPRVRK